MRVRYSPLWFLVGSLAVLIATTPLWNTGGNDAQPATATTPAAAAEDKADEPEEKAALAGETDEGITAATTAAVPARTTRTINKFGAKTPGKKAKAMPKRAASKSPARAKRAASKSPARAKRAASPARTARAASKSPARAIAREASASPAQALRTSKRQRKPVVRD